MALFCFFFDGGVTTSAASLPEAPLLLLSSSSKSFLFSNDLVGVLLDTEACATMSPNLYVLVLFFSSEKSTRLLGVSSASAVLVANGVAAVWCVGVDGGAASPDSLWAAGALTVLLDRRPDLLASFRERNGVTGSGVTRSGDAGDFGGLEGVDDGTLSNSIGS